MFKLKLSWSETPQDAELPFENAFLTQKRLFPGKFGVWGLHISLARPPRLRNFRFYRAQSDFSSSWGTPRS